MYLFYIDESGNTGADLSSTTEPIHWLFALGTTEQGVQRIESDMLAIATKYFRGRARDRDFELHGAEIFGGRGDARALTVAQRIGVFREALELLQRHDVKLWVRGIHKHRHAARARNRGYTPDHPYRLGFMYLVESIDLFLGGLQPSAELFAEASPPTLGLLVSDEQAEVSRDLIAGFARWRQFGTDHGYRTRDVRYLIDTIHYIESQDSWLIQLVDLVGFVRNRFEKNWVKCGGDETRFGQSEKSVAALWRLCAPCLVDSRVWPPDF
jgi:hypothetical protein